MASTSNDVNTKTPLLQGSINESAMKSKEEAINALTRRQSRRVKSTSTPSSPNSNPPQSSRPTFFFVLIVLAVYLGVGTVCFVLVRGQITGKKTNPIVDALYFCIVTMTTVGYGDLVPSTTLSKLMSCLFAFSGMAIVGLILSQAADYFVEKHEALMARALHRGGENSGMEILKEVENNKTRNKFVLALTLLTVLMTVGTLFLIMHEGMTVIDALYCVCSTMTTLGYGDQSFGSEGGRIFAVIWILSGTMCLAQLFYYLTELYTERRQRSVLKWVIERKLTFADIEAADMDNDKSVSAAEFILYKLKEMEKISSEDINILMECFRKLDVDESGTLTTLDIINAI